MLKSLTLAVFRLPGWHGPGLGRIKVPNTTFEQFTYCEFSHKLAPPQSRVAPERWREAVLEYLT